MTAAYVGIGANLGDALVAVRDAIVELGELPATRVVAVSSLYRTAPLEVPDAQPDYLNAAVQLETDLDAPALLEHLQSIERRHGRVRNERNAARTLDLDLLLFGGQQIRTPLLTVPHPRMSQRAFVLAPLVEIAPDLVIPGAGLARDLLPRLAGQRVERLESRSAEPA